MRCANLLPASYNRVHEELQLCVELERRVLYGVLAWRAVCHCGAQQKAQAHTSLGTLSIGWLSFYASSSSRELIGTPLRIVSNIGEVFSAARSSSSIASGGASLLTRTTY
jgi:hypothetical protein